MKIALCFSGQCRHVDRFEKNFEENLCKPLRGLGELYTFCHFWRGGVDSRNIYFETNCKTVRDVFRPTSFLLEDQINFPHSYPNPHTMSMYYSIRSVNNLKKMYEEENSMTFDIVVRLRNDLPILIPLDVKDLEKYIYVRPFMPGIAHDVFAIGNSINMNLYSQCFDGFASGEYMPWLSHPELAITEHLKRVGVEWQSLPFGFI